MRQYIYAADVYCEDCGRMIRKILAGAEVTPLDPNDEYSYDSNDFPKGPYESCETDTPEHCACGSDCLNAHVLPDGSKIGVWLENELTEEGVEYVKEAIQEVGDVADFWAELYCDYDLGQ